MTAPTTGNLGNPLAAVAWLVNRLAAYDVEFEAVQVILPASCLQAVPMNEAGHWSGTFEGRGAVESTSRPNTALGLHLRASTS